MEWASGNVFIRPMPHRLDRAGDSVEGHAHNFDHTSIVLRGAARFEAVLSNGPVSIDRFAADDEHGDTRCHVLIKAGVSHKITALTDNTIVWCVYAHRNPQGEVVQNFTGWEAAYV
jgi:hypothetical protein